jgi:hypothetical protein
MRDYSGGTNLSQNAAIFNLKYGIIFSVKYKEPWTTFRTKIKAGRGAVLQGGYDVVRLTRYSGSSSFYGNHAVYVNQVRYNSTYRRYEYLVGDPLCDGRRSGIPKGYQWWPESLLKSFAGRLMVGSYRLGSGYVYAMYTKDTEVEQVLTLRYGAHAVTARKLYAARVVAVKRAPNQSSSTVRKEQTGSYIFTRRQSTEGESVDGDRTWNGNLTGTEWVPKSRVKF